MFLTHVFKLVISTVFVLIGVAIIKVLTVNAWLAGQILIVLPSYTMPRTPPVFTPTARILAPIQIWLLLAYILTVAYRIDMYLKSSPGQNIDLRLLRDQGLLWQCQACLSSDGTSGRPNGDITLL